MPRNHDYVHSMTTTIDEDRLIALDMARKDLTNVSLQTYGSRSFSAAEAIARAKDYLEWLRGTD